MSDLDFDPYGCSAHDVKKMKDQLQRSLEDEEIAQYVGRLEKDIGTSINESAFAQVTGASNDANN